MATQKTVIVSSAMTVFFVAKIGDGIHRHGIVNVREFERRTKFRIAAN
ncbi:MAG TPA: hypothetical protein VN838_15760 [Bradyrhizobium sp.]|nr:hypothetical protein [Bradyrhizobium sp.]